MLCPNCHSTTDNFCRTKKKEPVSDETLRNAIEQSVTIHEALIRCRLSTCGVNFKRAKRLVVDQAISLKEKPLPKKLKNKGKKNIDDFSLACIVCGKPINECKTGMCAKCYAKYQFDNSSIPDRDELKNAIRTMTFEKVADQYKVSSTTIRNWCKHYKLPHHALQVRKIPEDDWNII